MGESTITNIWRSRDTKPDQVKTFKLSRTPKIADKLAAAIGLYLNPPERTAVLMRGREAPDSNSGPPGAGRKRGAALMVASGYLERVE